MKLTRLHCTATKVSDLSLLKDMPLAELQCDFNPEQYTVLLLSLKSFLRTINNKPAAEFWKEVDAKRSANKP